jgi:hypothetical protein
MLICPICQNENPAGAEYCEDCGAALKAPAPVGAGVAGGGSASASASGAGPTASSAPAPPAGSAAPSPASSGTTSTPSVPESVPTVPPSSSSSSAAADPAASGSAPSTRQEASLAEPAAPTTPATPATPSTPSTPATPSAPAGAGPQVKGRLIPMRFGAPTGDEIPLFGERLTVGRFDPETGPVDVDLSELDTGGHISRQHGELYREGDGWMVRDLGSTNGIFVKGSGASFGPRITAPRALSDGDEVAFGNVRFVFKTG